jgi:RND superfamily putative drug exporter
MFASLTLLPALLGIMGGRIERTVRRRASKAHRAEGALWRRWSAYVQRHRWLAVVLPVAALLAMSAPVLDMRLGFADAGNDAPSTTSRQAYDLIAKGFGPGYNGPLIVVGEGDGARSAASTLPKALEGTPGVAQVTPAIPAPDGRAVTVIIFPTTAPQDKATTDLVKRLRTDVLPPLVSQTGLTFSVGGTTAAVVDFSDAVAGRLRSSYWS